MAVFGLKYLTHDLGILRLDEQRLYVNKTVFPLEKMTQLKSMINSSYVFGKRNSQQGFKNFVEFLMNGEKKRYEFYIENQAMEDSLMNLLYELRTKYAVEVTVDKRSKESLFESWFGYG